MYNRKITKEIKIGDKVIGGNNNILIQSMTNTDTKNVKETVAQIKQLEKEGCEIIRVTVKDELDAKAIEEIKKEINIPLVADIHFNYRLAIMAIENGVDKIRINPGNIGSVENVEKIVNIAKKYKIPIRVGVNSGSLEKGLVDKYGGVTPKGLVESAIRNVKILEGLNFYDIVVSLKASSVPFTIEAYTLISNEIDYPLHLGITEAGTKFIGSIKSSAGLGALLSKGIGDTLRVSLTDDPIEELPVAKEILQSMGLRKFRIELISCPTCGRTEIDLIKIAKEVEQYCKNINKNITVAVMGCVVNGPGEAKEADYGIAGGKGNGLIFKKGVVIKKVNENEMVKELINLINEDN